MKNACQELPAQIEGAVLLDAISRHVYSVDASIYEIYPEAIAIPKHKEDVVRIVAFAKAHKIPVTARGAATGITGGCLGNGIVIDLSKSLNRILETNISAQYVLLEPGVVQDSLNAHLAPEGYRLGPDTSTGNRATVGGMLANNSAGAHSLKYGQMVDHVLGVEIVLASGETLWLEQLDDTTLLKKAAQDDTEGRIYRAVAAVRKNFAAAVAEKFPKIPRRVSGYNLDRLFGDRHLNLAELIAGSEGTLGIVTKIKLKISPVLQHTALCLLHFDEMTAGMKQITEILEHKPVAVEMIDDKIIAMARLAPSVLQKLDWLQGNPEALFIVEFEAASATELHAKLNAFREEMELKRIAYACTPLTDPAAISHVWEVRKAGLGLLLSKRSYSRAIAFIEDISVAPEKLAPFMEEFNGYLKSVGKEAGVYGHVGSGCMHLRPYMDLRDAKERALMETIMVDIARLIAKYEGSLSGEHGDGIVRSWLLPKIYGEKVMEAFSLIKNAFDPLNLMNPGKIVAPAPFLNDLRTPSGGGLKEIPTFMDFSKEGGFALAADLCNGNAQCRKNTQTMCPSFQATGLEYHTTRARAQVLRNIIKGELPIEEFTGEGLRAVLDLCLQCKGCKTECPSQVDMAKMKAEFLYQYHKKHGFLLRDRLFGFIGKINALSSPFAGVVNALNGTTLTKALLDYLGMAKQRDLPKLASQRFSRWFKQLRRAPKSGRQAVLFNDTFTEFNCPEIGIAAVHLLESLGYDVILPRWSCCGRTLISKGFLEEAQSYAKKLIDILHPYAVQDIPIIGLEPSCILTLLDEYQGLLGYEETKLQRVRGQCFTLSRFLALHLKEGELPMELTHDCRPVKLHGHCHQKALEGTHSSLAVLKAATRSEVAEMPTGCCGMAGSFGYEKEHYALSMKIATLKLVPEIQKAAKETVIIADGFSCRHQIEHATLARPLHLAEYLSALLKEPRN